MSYTHYDYFLLTLECYTCSYFRDVTRNIKMTEINLGRFERYMSDIGVDDKSK